MFEKELIVNLFVFVLYYIGKKGFNLKCHLRSYKNKEDETIKEENRIKKATPDNINKPKLL